MCVCIFPQGFFVSSLPPSWSRHICCPTTIAPPICHLPAGSRRGRRTKPYRRISPYLADWDLEPNLSTLSSSPPQRRPAPLSSRPGCSTPSIVIRSHASTLVASHSHTPRAHTLWQISAPQQGYCQYIKALSTPRCSEQPGGASTTTPKSLTARVWPLSIFRDTSSTAQSIHSRLARFAATLIASQNPLCHCRNLGYTAPAASTTPKSARARARARAYQRTTRRLR